MDRILPFSHPYLTPAWTVFIPWAWTKTHMFDPHYVHYEFLVGQSKIFNVWNRMQQPPIRDHPFKTSANFHDFWPLPSAFQQNAYEGDFWSLCTVTFWPSVNGNTPPPLRHADVLNGWSLCNNAIKRFSFHRIPGWNYNSFSIGWFHIWYSRLAMGLLHPSKSAQFSMLLPFTIAECLT